jgi:hypothetical protein
MRQVTQDAPQVQFRVRVWRPCSSAAPICLWASGLLTPSPNKSESRRKFSTGASAIALTRSLTTARPAAGNLAIRRASDETKSSSAAAGNARLIQPYRFSEVRVVVLGAQHDLQRPGAAHQAREVLSGAPAWDHSERPPASACRDGDQHLSDQPVLDGRMRVRRVLEGVAM